MQCWIAFERCKRRRTRDGLLSLKFTPSRMLSRSSSHSLHSRRGVTYNSNLYELVWVVKPSLDLVRFIVFVHWRGMQDGSVHMTVPSTVKLFFNPTNHCWRALSAILCIQIREVAFYPCVGAFWTLHGALNQYWEDINTFFEVLNWKKLVVEDPSPVGNPDTTKFYWERAFC